MYCENPHFLNFLLSIETVLYSLAYANFIFHTSKELPPIFHPHQASLGCAGVMGMPIDVSTPAGLHGHLCSRETLGTDAVGGTQAEVGLKPQLRFCSITTSPTSGQTSEGRRATILQPVVRRP